MIKTDSTAFTSMTIGAYTIIGNESIVKAMNIGSFVRIGKNCIIGDRSTIGDNCIIRDHTIVLPGTIIPNNTIWEGRPAKFVALVPDSTPTDHRNESVLMYESLLFSYN